MSSRFVPVPPDAWTKFEVVADETLTSIEDRELRVAVGSLFAGADILVESGEVDVVVLAARRLVCLYQLLVRHGMPPIGGLVVSDRYLESNPDLRERFGKPSRVLILDDSVVLGTTLRKLTLRLRELLGPQGFVRSAAVCVDDDQLAAYLLDGLDFEVIHHRDTQQVERYSAQIVQALFQCQVPFFADFPVTKALECELAAWESFLTTDEWSVADVTAPGMDATGNYALALIPTEATMERVLTRCAPAAASLVDAFKVRLYVRPTTSGVRAVIVPIAMMAPARPSTLDEALRSVVGHLEADTPLDLQWQSWAPEAKHRLLQLYAAVCVLAELWPRIEKTFSVGDPPAAALEALPTSLYFGDAAAEVAETFGRAVDAYEASPPGTYSLPAQVRLEEPVLAWFLLDEAVQRMFWETQELLESIGLPSAPSAGALTKAGLIFSHAVAAVFGFINREYELPQRDEIRALGSLDAYEAWLGDGSRRVLTQGITLRELDRFLLPSSTASSTWSRSLVSLAIDEGNDLGVMVPVTRYDATRDVVFRSYRIGETAPLASSPLVEATMSDRVANDYFIEAMLAGGPAEFRTTSVGYFVGLPGWSKSPLGRRDLERWVRSALPGRPVERFSGRIIDVVDDVVEAELVAPAEDDERYARIPVDRIDGVEDGRVGKGSGFTWTAFEQRSPGLVRRTIAIRVRPQPAIDIEVLARDEAALSPDDEGDAGAG